MIFDTYYSFKNKAGKICPGIKPQPMDWNRIKNTILSDEKTASLVKQYRETGDTDAKKSLPAICFVGTCKPGCTRAARNMIPTQLIMIDIDHCENPREAWQGIKDKMTNDWIVDNCIVAHITPSGKGLHLILKAQEGMDTLLDNMNYYNELIHFADYGDYDSVVHDFARLSFAFTIDDLLYESAELYLSITPERVESLKNPLLSDEPPVSKAEKSESKSSASIPVPVFTEEESKQFDEADWRGIKLKTIVDAWVKYRGEPGPQEVHNYYNEMVKYFRNIMGNNRRLVFYLLPRFGHSADECWSQVVSITRSNTLSMLDKPFYFWLRDNGFYVSKNPSSADNYLLSDDVDHSVENMPKLPPVFREFVNTAPNDFKVPLVNALLPILGTLTSYLEAIYPYDDVPHTTSFFSIIYAPPGTGKGFVSRLDWLFDDLKLRDEVQSARENVYLRIVNRKSQNDKSPDLPHTSLRIIPPKNSEAEFLQKQKDNQGYHMFTFAAEMDSWAKGEKAAGGNKSDMIRIAWDNGEYGQQFKSPQTFKGKVRLYWNVLITGTQAQVESYFKNVENGLVTRCSFTSIENQQFQLASIWKQIPKKGVDIIKRFMQRCDENTYEEPCTVNIADLELVDDENFDKEIDWRFKFKPRQMVDINWIMPVIDKFHKVQVAKASKDLDSARDVFRRRVGVRGFRLALLCTALYPKINKKAIETIKGFVAWWMDVDIENMLKLWGAKYNEQAEVTPKLYNRSAFDSLNDEFTKNDIFVILKRQNIKTPVKQVLYTWKKNGYIEKIDKENYKKTAKTKKG